MHGRPGFGPWHLYEGLGFGPCNLHKDQGLGPSSFMEEQDLTYGTCTSKDHDLAHGRGYNYDLDHNTFLGLNWIHHVWNVVFWGNH